MMQAVKRFDPQRGVRLVSFAIHWIKAEIHEYVLRNWRLVKVATTKAQRKLFFNLRSMRQGLAPLSPDEVKRLAGIEVPLVELRRILGRLGFSVAGSGPAYFFLLMEALESAAMAQGLSAHAARALVLQTALGAARMARESDEAPATLRARVTSPGGTTAAALSVLMAAGGLEELMSKAVAAAAKKIGRQALHASKLTFFHPHTREPVEFTAPIPADMREALNILAESGENNP